MTIDVHEPLTSGERTDLEQLELIVAMGVAAFYEVGRALREIRDRKLYRDEALTFSQYLKRWQRRIGRRRAEQLMAAAEIADNLGIDFALEEGEMRTTGSHYEEPLSERQLRPLGGLPPQEQRAVWEDATRESGGRPSGRQVEEARARLEAQRRRESTVSGASERLAPVRDERARRLERVRDHLRQVRRHLEALDEGEALERLQALEQCVEGMA